MELVYLWVEEYKNIKEQGFNFSPRFRCEYDDESNKLTIEDNPDFVDIFPPNINITAIVGENGSGKSSLLIFLNLLSSNRLRDGQDGFAIFIDCANEKYYLGDKEKYIGKEQYKKIDTDRISFPIFDYSFTYEKTIGNFSELQFPKKLNGIINLNEELEQNLENIVRNYLFIKEKNLNHVFGKYFTPHIIQVSVTSYIENLKLEHLDTNLGNAFKQIIDETISLFEENKPNEAIENLLYILHMPHAESNHCSAEEFIKEAKKNASGRNLPESLYQKNLYQFHKGNRMGDFRCYQNSFKSFNVRSDNQNVKIAKSIGYNPFKDVHAGEIFFKWDINQLYQNEVDIILSTFSYPFFAIELFDKNNKNLNELSFGEQQLLFILNQLFSFKNTIIQKKEINDLIILLDEIDIGFHPDWQKRVIGYMIDFLKLIPAKNFHLIFASHSPFLISDLPKQNIIFLKDGKQVAGVEKKQTFGANIHTLLSDSFFMSGGLMGEFAKSKIDEVITLLNKDKLSKSELKHCEQIISIIGEPIIKNQLQRMLDSKRLKKVDKIDKIEQDIRRLKQSLKELKR